MFLPTIVSLLLFLFHVRASPLLDVLGPYNTCPIVTITPSPITITIPGATNTITLTETATVTTSTTTVFVPQTNTAVAKRDDTVHTKHTPTPSPHRHSRHTKTPRPTSYHTTTTCTSGITITLPAVSVTTTAADVTITASTTVTVSVLATTTSTANTFKLQINAPTSSTYNGVYLQASPDTQVYGALNAYNNVATIFAVDSQGRLLVHDPSNNYNGYMAFNRQGSTLAYKTVDLATTPPSDTLACNFVGDQLTCVDSTSGEAIFEICGYYLRMTLNPAGDGNDCAIATLTTIDPSTT